MGAKKLFDMPQLVVLFHMESMGHSSFLHGITPLPPMFDAAVHGRHANIAHALQNVGGESAAKSAAAIENNFSVSVWDCLLDIPFEHPFT